MSKTNLEIIRDYRDTLETEFKRQKADYDFDSWATFSANLNRPFREFLEALDDKPAYELAYHAFLLWVEYNKFLRDGAMNIALVRRIRTEIDNGIPEHWGFLP